jgi:small subunit ribosomal protein S23
MYIPPFYFIIVPNANKIILYNSAIRFAVSLHEHHNVPVSRAYTMAVEQFRSLRSEHHIATTMAVVEAEEFGAEFGPTMNERMFVEEMKAVDSWQSAKESNEAAMASSKKWKAIIDKTADHEPQWTKGQEYVRLWKDGVRPSYAPALTEPIMSIASGLTPESTQEQMAADPALKDFAIR